MVFSLLVGTSMGLMPPCTTCIGPRFSWDTIPTFIHSSDQCGGTDCVNNGLSTADLALITRKNFSLVTLEKWQGANISPPITEEDAWVSAAKQIKQIDPSMFVLVWLDSFRIYTADKALNPDLGTWCGTGHFGPAEFLETGGKMDGKLDPTSPYLLKNKSGLPALESWSKCHIFDHTAAIARNYWTDMCLNLTASGVIDGCGADASWQNGVDQMAEWEISSTTATAWEAGHKAMMLQTTEALNKGILMGKDPWELAEGYVNGALHEGCDADEATILTLQNLTKISKQSSPPKRMVYECHGTGDLDELAAFLIGAGPYHYYGFGGWTGMTPASQHWMPEFAKPLGEPLADGAKDATTGIWSRAFQSGTNVTFDLTTTPKGTISWGS